MISLTPVDWTEHSPAATCRMARMSWRSTTDDGEGFDPHVEPGLGLVGMRERAELLGGRLYVGRQESGGTRLRVDIPLEVRRG